MKRKSNGEATGSVKSVCMLGRTVSAFKLLAQALAICSFEPVNTHFMRFAVLAFLSGEFLRSVVMFKSILSKVSHSLFKNLVGVAYKSSN